MAVDVNFALILTLSVLVTGLISLVDLLFFKPGRLASAAEIKDEKKLAEALEPPVLIEYSVSFFPVLLLVLVIRSFIIEPYQIPTGSMIPTLAVGDFIVVNKYAYGIRLPVIGTKIVDVDDPVTGDVMVFVPPHEPDYFIKRVIGTPGDRVRYENKTLYINGEESALEFVARLPPDNPQYLVYKENLAGVEHFIHRNLYRDPRVQEWVVPEGHYFMMGDNRDKSSDSRYWGMVPEENIVGKAFGIWMHKDPGFHLPNFDRNGAIN